MLGGFGWSVRLRDGDDPPWRRDCSSLREVPFPGGYGDEEAESEDDIHAMRALYRRATSNVQNPSGTPARGTRCISKASPL